MTFILKPAPLTECTALAVQVPSHTITDSLAGKPSGIFRALIALGRRPRRSRMGSDQAFRWRTRK